MVVVAVARKSGRVSGLADKTLRSMSKLGAQELGTAAGTPGNVGELLGA